MSQLRQARSVLCCASCEGPLSSNSSGGHQCNRCNYVPSMQDTYIEYHCPDCRRELDWRKENGKDVKEWPRQCPGCLELFAKPSY